MLLVARRSLARLISSLVALVSLCAIPTTTQGEMVYVTSFGTGELARFDTADPVGTKTTLIAGGSLVSPTSLAFGPDGKLYIGASGDGGANPPLIARYDIGLNSLSTVYTFSSYEVFPGSLAFKGNNLLVGRNPYFGALPGGTGEIIQLTGITGGSPTSGNYTSGGVLASSPGIALAADGRLYVSDQTYSGGLSFGPVMRFDASGNNPSQVIADGVIAPPPPLPTLPALAGPTGLAIQGNTLFTSSIMNSGILSTDLTSNSTSTFYDFGGAVFPGSLASLAGGGLLVGDASGAAPSEIYRLNSNGTLHSSFSLGLGAVGGIAVAPVPEPGTMALVGAGLVGGVALLRRRRRATMTA